MLVAGRSVGAGLRAAALFTAWGAWYGEGETAGAGRPSCGGNHTFFVVLIFGNYCRTVLLFMPGEQQFFQVVTDLLSVVDLRHADTLAQVGFSVFNGGLFNYHFNVDLFDNLVLAFALLRLFF